MRNTVTQTHSDLLGYGSWQENADQLLLIKISVPFSLGKRAASSAKPTVGVPTDHCALGLLWKKESRDYGT